MTNGMILSPLTEIRARTDPGDAHLAHVALHGFAIDQHFVVRSTVILREP